MKYRGYEKFVHYVFARAYGPECATLTPDQFELWWRSFTDEERQQEYDEAMALIPD